VSDMTSIKFIARLLLVCAMLAASVGAMAAAAAKSDGQSDWEKTLAAATKKAQVTVYGPPAISYQHAIAAFQSSFPKIKLNYRGSSGHPLVLRLH